MKRGQKSKKSSLSYMPVSTLEDFLKDRLQIEKDKREGFDTSKENTSKINRKEIRNVDRRKGNMCSIHIFFNPWPI